MQKRAAKFVSRNYSRETGSMTGILGKLNWETLQKRRKDNRLIFLYKGLKGRARIPTVDLIKKTTKKQQALQKSTLNGLSDSLY